MKRKWGLVVAVTIALSVVSGAPAHASGGVPPWKPCPTSLVGGQPNKVIKTYSVKRGNPPGGGIFVPPTGIDLKCGATDGSNHGYFHIKLGKQKDWAAQAAKTQDPGYTWEDMADFAIEQTLRDPDKQFYVFGAEKWCYSRVIFLKNKRTGQAVGQTTAVVAFSNNNRLIISARPSSDQCSARTLD